jgi:hypothetical protein
MGLPGGGRPALPSYESHFIFENFPLACIGRFYFINVSCMFSMCICVLAAFEFRER